MSLGKINISTEVQKTMAVPMRSQKPKDPNQIRHCVAFNVIVVRVSYYLVTFFISKKNCFHSKIILFVEIRIRFLFSFVT